MKYRLTIALLAAAAMAGACNRENQNDRTGVNTTGTSGGSMNTNGGTTTTTPRNGAPTGATTPAPPAAGVDADSANPQLAQAVRQALATDRTLAAVEGLKITAEKDGTVKIQGKVPTQAEKDRIAAKVVTIPGVREVNNNLDVDKSVGAPPEKQLESSVRAALGSDSSLPAVLNLEIHADDEGTVEIKGQVPTQADKARVIEKVRSVPGVKKVDDNLDVKS